MLIESLLLSAAGTIDIVRTRLTSDQQAEAAAFMLNLTRTVSNRFERLLYTRIWEPDGQWWSMFCSDP